MHPELLNNAIFLRYYKLWQKDPTCVVFSAIAEYLIAYRMYDEAIQICKEGLVNNPGLVSGRLALAKAYLKKKDYGHTRDILKHLLMEYPEQEKALELWEITQKASLAIPPAAGRVVHAPTATPPKKEKAGWETLTMAKIYAAQGHTEKARQVYQTILKKEPQNKEAMAGLHRLGSEE